MDTSSEIQIEPAPDSARNFFVVGVGASAGGLEALEIFFREMPLDNGLAFVIVQHLSPDFKSVMAELLARVTKIPIHIAENGLLIEPGNIYLLPPKSEMICTGEKLLLTERHKGSELRFPIDQFMRSLAQDIGPRAIGVILSGTGTDGSRGIRSIHEAGGLVLAQNVESAKFDGMPRAALDTTVVELALRPEEMPAALISFAQNPKKPIRKEESDPMEGPMYTVFHLLKKHCGVDFSDYKTTTIERRIQRRVMLSGTPGLETYVEMLQGNLSEVDRLYKDLLIGVTMFFRDKEVFERLELDVIPRLIDRLAPDEEFRVWVVGSATGEEAYSLAILISEYLLSQQKSLSVKIFATDIHRESLSHGSRGIYQEASLAAVTPQRRDQYFVEKPDGFHVIPQLRKMVVFVAQNFVHDAPFTKLDLITCRNVMIYLATPAQKRALSLFHFALKRDGALCLGPSESLGDLANEFQVIDERCRIYRKDRESRLPASTRMNVQVPSHRAMVTTTENPTLSHVVSTRDLIGAYDSLLEEFMPPSLLLNSRHELMHCFRGGSKYLKQRDGRATSDVLNIVHADIRPTLSAALRRAERESKAVAYTGIRCTLTEGVENLDILVHPVISKSSGETAYVAVFQSIETAPRPGTVSVDRFDASAFSTDEMTALESELQQTRDSLQATIEQLQETNEELQSTNEQLLASNEELQSTNEELHSVNEELYTVNAEHQRKIDELTELTDDMDNLLNSTNVHTIFLDSDLCIRRFTPGIADTFSLIPQDVGRRIDTFTYNLLHADLVSEIKEVLTNEVPFEREVRDRNENWYLLRIRPYISSGRVDGVVLTLIEITSLKRAERKLEIISEIVEHSDDAILRIDPSGTVSTWNHGAEKLFGFSAQQIIGQSEQLLIPPEFQQEASEIHKRVFLDESIDHFETRRLCADGRQIDVSLTLSPIGDEKGDVVGASEIVRDITAQKKAEEEVRAAVRHRDQFLAMLSHELRNPMAAVLSASNLFHEDQLDDVVFKEAHDIVERNVRHMARLLDDLLDLSRITHDKISVHKQVVDLNELMPDVAECVQHHFDEKHHELHMQCCNEQLFILGDVGRIQQAQVNLLINAAKYTGEGGRIEYIIRREGDEAVIIFRDNGIGIPAEFLENIFEPFIQSEQALDRSQGGMGLGLPLVRMIGAAHGGKVSAHSAGRGKGSEFVLRLPLTEQRPVAKPSERLLDAEGRKMLIVEDNDGIRKMLALSMELKGFRVAVAADGSQGMEKFVDFEPEIALVDIGLPDVNGYELAKQIREKPAFRDTLLVAVTGYGRESDREKAQQAGFDLHLVKPLDPNEVLMAVSQWIVKTKETTIALKQEGE